jgi:hypothetical protein
MANVIRASIQSSGNMPLPDAFVVSIDDEHFGGLHLESDFERSILTSS